MITPDRSFMKDLKLLDRRLDCVFRQEHCHFVIVYKRDYGDPVNLALVEGDDGAFRQPDKRDIAFISSGDLARTRPKDHLARTAQYMEAIREGKRVKAKGLIRDWTADDKIQLMQAMGQLVKCGKFNSAFRRIEHKLGKNTVMVTQ